MIVGHVVLSSLFFLSLGLILIYVFIIFFLNDLSILDNLAWVVTLHYLSCFEVFNVTVTLGILDSL